MNVEIKYTIPSISRGELDVFQALTCHWEQCGEDKMISSQVQALEDFRFRIFILTLSIFGETCAGWVAVDMRVQYKTSREKNFLDLIPGFLCQEGNDLFTADKSKEKRLVVSSEPKVNSSRRNVYCSNEKNTKIAIIMTSHISTKAVLLSEIDAAS